MRISRGKSRSISGGGSFSPSYVSGRNRSNRSPNLRGSICDSPVRYPVSNATDDPRPRPGGSSSIGSPGSTRPRSSWTSRAILMMS